LRLGIYSLDLLAVTSEDEDDGTLRHFVIKREFAEGAIMMSMVKFPADALPTPGQPAPMMYRYSSSFISFNSGIFVVCDEARGCRGRRDDVHNQIPGRRPAYTWAACAHDVHVCVPFTWMRSQAYQARREESLKDVHLS